MHPAAPKRRRPRSAGPMPQRRIQQTTPEMRRVWRRGASTRSITALTGPRGADTRVCRVDTRVDAWRVVNFYAGCCLARWPCEFRGGALNRLAGVDRKSVVEGKSVDPGARPV